MDGSLGLNYCVCQSSTLTEIQYLNIIGWIADWMNPQDSTAGQSFHFPSEISQHILDRLEQNI